MGLHVRLIILAALGVGLLYTVHLLAQDYNKIRKPNKGKSFSSIFAKREAMDYQPLVPLEEICSKSQDLVEIFSTDHFNCGKSLACHILSKSENGSQIENTLHNYLKFSTSFKSAKFDAKACEDLTHSCPFNFSFLINLIGVK